MKVKYSILIVVVCCSFKCMPSQVSDEDKKMINDLTSELHQQTVYYDSVIAQKDMVILRQADTLNFWRPYVLTHH